MRNRQIPLRVTDPFSPLVADAYALRFAELQARRPTVVSHGDWKRAIADASDFLRWHEISARRMGWSARELFDAPSEDNEGGLIWWLRSDPVLRLTREHAYLVSGRIFYRSSINPRLSSHHNAARLAARLESEAALPRNVAQHLANLFLYSELKDFIGLRWRKAQAGAEAFAFEWGAIAIGMGWSHEELFGLDPVAPAARVDRQGLAWMLDADSWVRSLDESGADIMTVSGSSQRFYRRRL